MVCPKLKKEAEARALADYQALLGKVVLVHTINGYDEREYSRDVRLDPPALVRIEVTDLDSVVRAWMDDSILDPVYDVSLVGPTHPQLLEMGSFWVYGTSYHVESEGLRAAPGDILEVRPNPMAGSFTVSFR